MTTTTAGDPAPAQPAPAGFGRRSAQAVLGAAILVSDRLIGDGRAGRWSDVAVGFMVEAEKAAEERLAELRRAAARRRERIAELAARGAIERERGRRRAVAAVEGAATAVGTSYIVDRVVDAQLERILRPVVLAVLDDVLALLEREPERVQNLIRGQRDSMVDELVTRIRTGAAIGDSAVDRLISRMLRRSLAQAAPAAAAAPTPPAAATPPAAPTSPAAAAAPAQPAPPAAAARPAGATR